MVTIVVAEPVDVLDAGEVADFGRGEAANSRGRRAPRAQKKMSAARPLHLK